MIELKKNELVFSFPGVHDHATMGVDFQRTLRIPDDDGTYPLPAGFGRFPVRHVDDHANRVPDQWMEHGGVMLPMYQSEALWMNFSGPNRYPFAVKIAAGKIDAVTGKSWSNGLNRGPQDYVVVPKQPWLDGYCVKKGIIRQFVAMPLGAGYTAEEQLTGEAEVGGIQIIAYPMRAEIYEERVRPRLQPLMRSLGEPMMAMSMPAGAASMGLGAGGRMKQDIYRDPYDFSDWDVANSSRCFIHIANSLAWREVTGETPPTTPFTAKEYEKHGVPWFDYYGEGDAPVSGTGILDKVKSIAKFGQEKGDVPFTDNDPVTPKQVFTIGKKRLGQVREGKF